VLFYKFGPKFRGDPN